MLANRVTFFSDWHNGDIFSNKQFVKHFSEVLVKNDISVEYAANKPIEVINLHIPYRNIDEYRPHVDLSKAVVLVGEHLFINTWIGNYPRTPGHNYFNQIPMWNSIRADVFGYTGVDVELGPIYDYISEIEEDMVKKITLPSPHTILICNTTIGAGQSWLKDYDKIAEYLSPLFPRFEFLFAQKFETSLPNVSFTDDITSRAGQDGFDLAEIGLFSQQCRVIVTNSSGPGTFIMTKNNFNDRNKTIIAFVTDYGHTFWNGLEGNIKAKCIWSSEIEWEPAARLIENEIRERML